MKQMFRFDFHLHITMFKSVYSRRAHNVFLADDRSRYRHTTLGLSLGSLARVTRLSTAEMERTEHVGFSRMTK
jgi:hypothetical protein